MVLLLLALSASYWYCLPLVSQAMVGYSEFRIYDVLLACLIAVLAIGHRAKLRGFLRRDPPGRWLFRFCKWATLTYPLTAAWSVLAGRSTWALVTAIYLFHLWGFVLSYAAFRIFLKKRRQCYRMLDTFLMIGATQAVLICLQALEVIPRFWSALYESYGSQAFSGTLGPNRQLPAHAMLLVLCVAVAYCRNWATVGATRVLLAALAVLAAVPALVLSGSRTAWVATAVFAAVSLIDQRSNLIMFVLIGGLGGALVVATPASVRERLEATYEWRVAGRLSGAPPGAVAAFQSVDAGRLNKWEQSLHGLVERPWLVLSGAGFNNRFALSQSGNSPHNIYLALIAELGLFGLYLYLKWLQAWWRQSSHLAAWAARLSKRGRKRVFLPVEMRSLLAALAVSLLAGEILYIYRPAFAFMGLVLFLCAVMNHPRLVADLQPRRFKATVLVSGFPASARGVTVVELPSKAG